MNLSTIVEFTKNADQALRFLSRGHAIAVAKELGLMSKYGNDAVSDVTIGFDGLRYIIYVCPEGWVKKTD